MSASFRPFRPLPLLGGGRRQTVLANIWPPPQSDRESSRHRIGLPDGDALIALERRPPAWEPGQRVAIVWHGMLGSHASPYVSRLTRRLLDGGLCVLRPNMRGCGAGLGYARGLCHAGRSDDVRQVAAWATRRYRQSPITLIGFSMGGAMILKMTGEDGDAPTGNVDSAVVVSAPVDLALCARTLTSRRNLFFDQLFVQRLRWFVKRRHHHYPDLPRPRLPRLLTLPRFDDLYTAPQSGFRDAADYYHRSSASHWLNRIRVPTLAISAKDDPITGHQRFDGAPPGLELVEHERGGHVGFLGRPDARTIYWADAHIAAWVQRLPSIR